MVAMARRHRIHLILAADARSGELEDTGSATLLAELREAVLVDMKREQVLRGLLGRFAAAGIDALLLKGAGVAYTLYRSPHLRPRGDVDLMVARADLDRAERTLAEGGWTCLAEQDGELITTQRHYVPSGPTAFAEPLDLHWKIANPQLFREVVSFEELLSRAVPVAALGATARALSDTDALLVACVHRVAHHQDVGDLLWLWDIHLLASRLSVEERSRFATLAARASMRAVCGRSLELAAARFRTAGAADLIAAPATYMRSAYPHCPTAALPLAYVHRIARGAPKWFRRP
jgi:hypothetical protein